MSTAGESAVRDITFIVNVRTAIEAAKPLQEIAKETKTTTAAIDDLGKRSASASKEAERAAKNLETAQEQLSRVIISRNDQMARAFRQSLTGVEQLARGIVILGVVGKDDLEKVLRVLLKFQAGFDILRGSVNIIQAGTRAWNAYRTAVAAAAVAQEALASAQAKSAATGALAAGAGGGGLGRNAAGGAAGGLATRALPLAGRAGVVGGAALAGTAAIAGVIAIINKDFREGILELIGFTDAAGESLNKFGKMLDAQSSRRAELRSTLGLQAQQRQAGLNFGFGAIGLLSTGSGATALESRSIGIERQLDAARGELLSSRERFSSIPEGRDADIRRLDAQGSVVADLERIRALEEERLKIIEEQQRTAIKGVEEQLRGAEKLSDQLDRIAKQDEDRQKSALERFGNLNSVEQRQLKDAGEKAARGEELTKRERRLLSSSGFEGAAGVSREQAEAKARRKLGGSLFLESEDERVASSRRRADEAAKLTAELKNEISIKIETNQQEVIDVIEERIRPILAEQRDALLDLFERQQRIQFREQQLRRVQSEGLARNAT